MPKRHTWITGLLPAASAPRDPARSQRPASFLSGQRVAALCLTSRRHGHAEPTADAAAPPGYVSVASRGPPLNREPPQAPWGRIARSRVREGRGRTRGRRASHAHARKTGGAADSAGSLWRHRLPVWWSASVEMSVPSGSSCRSVRFATPSSLYPRTSEPELTFRQGAGLVVAAIHGLPRQGGPVNSSMNAVSIATRWTPYPRDSRPIASPPWQDHLWIRRVVRKWPGRSEPWASRASSSKRRSSATSPS
jgi:hypothetical protein